MNLKICKKCEKLKDKNCSFVLVADDFYNNYGMFLPCWVDNDTTFQEWICQCKPLTRDVSIAEIEVHKDCPYYMEHKLSEWNK